MSTDPLLDEATRLAGVAPPGSAAEHILATPRVLRALVERVQEAEAERDATRTRVITTVDQLDALADRTCIIDADMEFHQRHGSLLDRTVESAWLGFLSPTLRAASEIRLPARVLHEPESA